MIKLLSIINNLGKNFYQNNGDWRNWLARSVRDAEVAGSNPVSPT